jgi:hypothetical protein
MYSYKDHYSQIDFDMANETPEESAEHKDHCIEVLRQRLMCNPDLNVYTYHWVDRFEKPWANLFSSHRCVVWDHFHQWAEANTVSFPVNKPLGVEVYD